MPTTPRTREIYSLIQKYLKTGDESLITDLTLAELENTDTDLGGKDKDTPWRIELQKRIIKLKQEKENTEKKSEQKKRDKEAKRMHRQTIGIAALAIIIPAIVWLLGN